MKQAVERILSGKFEYDKGTLDFSCARIELSLQPGELCTDSFRIISSPGRFTEGFIYSKDIRMHLLTDRFAGMGEEIGYTFSAVGLDEGDVVKGEIYVISNQGEYYLPYVVTIAHSSIETSMGNIRNLFHFANLAKTNWDEAVKLFYSERFTDLFKGNDRQYIRAYRALSSYFGNEQNVEEFLLEINKKHAVEYILEKNEIILDEPYAEVLEYIDVTRNGWGYTFLNVDTDMDFVELSQTTVTDNDFLGNFLHFGIVINPEKLHDGNNYGVVRFFNSFTSFEVSVKVNRDSTIRQDISKDVEYNRALIDMVTYYKAFRLKQISTDTWIAQTGIIIDRMANIRFNDVIARMFKAQLLITQERYNEAKWIIDQIRDELSSSGCFLTPKWAYYLYLTTLLNREDSYIDKITEEVEMIYNADQSQWRVAWILLYLSEEFAISPSKRWLFIENQLNMNCTSPIIYVEAANMLTVNPSLLSKLDPPQARVIRFMIKEDILTKELVRQIVYLAGTGKWYSEAIIEILKHCYEIMPDGETLTAFCNLLISHDRKEPQFFQWYRLALEAEVRVTMLYEYYMMSLDLNIPVRLPKTVYLYFSYENSLDWEHTAYLYARVIENRREDEDMFYSYKDQIDRFAIEQIAEQHMNRDLATIYRLVLNESVVTREMADKLVSLIFTHRLVVDSNNVNKVIVFQSRECDGTAYPIRNHEAFVPIYNKDFTIAFEDGFSNRYMKSVNYDTEKLMVPGKLANVMLPYVSDNLAFDVYACECSSEMVEIDDENRVRYQRILDAPEIEPFYKTEIRTKLMLYYYDNDRIRELDNLLESLDPAVMMAKERNIAIRYMVIRGMFDKAYAWVKEYGTEGVEPKDMVKLCSSLISRSDFVPSDEITCITASCFFKGKYDETILTYLCDNYHGMTKDMRKLFAAAENFDTDIFGMCENLLIQMLYTGYYISERMEIYKKYVAKGGDGDVRMAFLTRCCFEYFVRDQLTESYVFDEITKLTSRGEQFLTVVKLAYVRFYSEIAGHIEDEVRHIIKTFLNEVIAKGIYFSYFKEFMEQGIDEINRFSDKTFVEYKTDPGKRVMIHYIIEHDEDSKGEYITEEMKDMYGGVHVKSFILFFGENLQYYITEEGDDGEEQLTESGNIQKSDIGSDIQASRFSEINDIVIAHTLQDYETAEHLIYEYRRKEFIINSVFTME
ncbi:MAG: DUF5717 family protein [Lachnospiraceae bacterium]|nr:DUF5717 family protein [Lachnospiraceae bacterium]